MESKGGWSNTAVAGIVMTTVFLMSMLHYFNITNHVELEYKPLLFTRPKPVALAAAEQNQQRTVTNETTIWVAMGLCFSENTMLYGKHNYPYVTVTPLAILLWNYFLPRVKIILFLVHTPHESQERMMRYEASLNQMKRLEYRWVLAENISCVLMSQTSRLWAFSDPVVKDEDIVITIDVNAFVVTSKAINPIFENPHKLVWVFQYEESASVSTGIGETFNQNFIAAYADVWKEIVSPEWSESGVLDQSWIDRQVQEIGLGEGSMWYYDQWITTHGILRNQFCTVPPESGLWNLPGLKRNNLYFPDLNDTDTCWHGVYYGDCNNDIHIVAHGCKWWHFFPSQEFSDHVDKFNELTENYYNLNLTEMFSSD